MIAQNIWVLMLLTAGLHMTNTWIWDSEWEVNPEGRLGYSHTGQKIEYYEDIKGKRNIENIQRKRTLDLREEKLKDRDEEIREAFLK